MILRPKLSVCTADRPIQSGNRAGLRPTNFERSRIFMLSMAGAIAIAGAVAPAATVTQIGVVGVSGTATNPDGGAGGSAIANASGNTDAINTARATGGSGGYGYHYPIVGNGGNGGAGGNAAVTIFTGSNTAPLSILASAAGYATGGTGGNGAVAFGSTNSGGNGGNGGGATVASVGAYGIGVTVGIVTIGGDGGSGGGIEGVSTGTSGNGGQGGDAIVDGITAVSTGTAGINISILAQGGNGGNGGSSGNGADTMGVGGNGGMSTILGTVSGVSTGGGAVTISLKQVGGSGATGQIQPYFANGGGNGADSTLSTTLGGSNNAIYGATAGILTLTQDAIGGSGGYGLEAQAGVAGNATSTLDINFNSNPAVGNMVPSALIVTSSAVEGGGGSALGQNVGASAGTAYAEANVTAATNLQVNAIAGSSGTVQIASGHGFSTTNGNLATAIAEGSSTSALAGHSAVDVNASAVASNGGASETGNGGNGGEAMVTSSGSNIGPNAVNVTAYAVGGYGGSGIGNSNSGGNGGLANASGNGVSTGGGDVTVDVTQTGGNGGTGLTGALGGDGANSSLSTLVGGTANAVNGGTTGILTFNQTAISGSGGNALRSTEQSTTGASGTASSILNFNLNSNPLQDGLVPSLLIANATATAGNGGGDDYGNGGSVGSATAAVNVVAPTAIQISAVANATAPSGGGDQGQTAVGGSGGPATATATAFSTGTNATDSAISATAFARGVNGGSAGYRAAYNLVGAGGAGGDAIARASGSNSGPGAMSISSTATGGSGGAGVAYDTPAGQGGSAAAAGSGYSSGGGNVSVTVTQIGGNGGNGGFVPLEGNGGNGASSTLSTTVGDLNNAIAGDTSGKLILTQFAGGGQGGSAEAGTAGAGGNASSTLDLNLNVAPQPSDGVPSTLVGYSSATAGSGGMISGGVGLGGAAGAANAEITLTAPTNIQAAAEADNSPAVGGSSGGYAFVPSQASAGTGGNAAASATAVSTNPSLGHSSVSATADAIGSNGGSINPSAGSSGNRGSGGSATATANGENAGPNAVTVSATATGGNGGSGAAGDPGGNGGNATAMATGTSTGGGSANVSATAAGGVAASGGLNGLSLANASGFGNAGVVTTTASSGTGANLSIISQASAPVIAGNSVSAEAFADSQGSLHNIAAVGNVQSSAFGTELPASSNMLGLVTLGFSNMTTGAGAIYHSETDWSVNLASVTQTQQHLLVRLLGASATGSGLVTFSIDQNGASLVELNSATFSAAQSFFNGDSPSGNTLDLGSTGNGVATGNDLTLNFTLDVVPISNGATFVPSLIFGNSNISSIPLSLPALAWQQNGAGQTFSFTSGSPFGTGSVVLTGPGDILQYAANGINISNDLQFSSGGATIDADGYTGTWSGAISGAGTLTVTASAPGSVLILDPHISNSYSGGTQVINGVTVVAATPSAFGTGAMTVAGSTVDTINSYDFGKQTLSTAATSEAIVLGGYSQDAASTLNLMVMGRPTTNNYDSLAVGANSVSLNGTLNLVFSSASGANFRPADFDSYTVISSTGTNVGVTAADTTLATPIENGGSTYGSGWLRINPNAGNRDLNYFERDPSGNQVVTVQTLFLPFAQTPNERAVAQYIDLYANPSDSAVSLEMQNALANLSLQPAGDIAVLLNMLTPQAYSELPQQSIQNNTFMAQQVFNQVQNAFDSGGFNTSGLTMLKTNDQDPFAVSMDAALASAQQQAQNSVAYMDNSPQLVGMPGVGPIVPSQESPLSNLSGFVLGTITVDQLQQNNTPTQHFTTGSVMAGLDYRLNRNLVIGGLFNWGYTGGTMDNVGSRQRSSSYTPGVFVGYKQGGFYADGLMSYTYNSYQINRSVNMPGSSSIATGEPDSNEYDANALVGYYLPLARGFQAGPAAGAGFTQINTCGYSETGSPFDLTVAKQHADSLRSLLGMQALYSFAPENNPLPISINFNAFWQHEFLDSSRNINASFTQLGGGNFIYNTAGPSRDSALLGLGASGYINQQISLFVNYETQVGDHRQFAQTVMAGVAVSF